MASFFIDDPEKFFDETISILSNEYTSKEMIKARNEFIEKHYNLLEEYNNIENSEVSSSERESKLDAVEEEYKDALINVRRIEKTLLEKEYKDTQKELENTLKNYKRMNTKIDLLSKNENASLKVYPNDLCPCGSGKKFKKCCGK